MTEEMEVDSQGFEPNTDGNLALRDTNMDNNPLSMDTNKDRYNDSNKDNNLASADTRMNNPATKDTDIDTDHTQPQTAI